MKQLKTIVALVAGLFSFTSVQAGELTVSGTMQTTYQTEASTTTGNPLGLNTDMTFSGSTDVLNGTTATWTMGTDGTFASESGADHKIVFSNDYGNFRIGNTGDSANAVDDITPTAFEEANGSGSGSYTQDFGSGMEGSMGMGYANSDIMGSGVSVDYTYYPKLDATTNNEKGASGDSDASLGNAQSINIGLPVSSIPGVGGTPLGGLKVTLGYYEQDAIVALAQDKRGATVAVNLPVGPLSVGFQKKGYQNLGTDGTDAQQNFFKDNIYGVAYAVNDEIAVSYNVIESARTANNGAGNVEQETKAINVAYTVGGLTIGFQDAKTDNSGYVANTDNDTRTISLKTAF
ncbi:hypothetical protein N9N34_02660 [Candidatus Pelagibacter bacterium]|nr:hypothetical protein [Candidatus Pelagibacter bacterium]